jgi:hypothetical protein
LPGNFGYQSDGRHETCVVRRRAEKNVEAKQGWPDRVASNCTDQAHNANERDGERTEGGLRLTTRRITMTAKTVLNRDKIVRFATGFGVYGVLPVVR